jgi:hypothetical protein
MKKQLEPKIFLQNNWSVLEKHYFQKYKERLRDCFDIKGDKRIMQFNCRCGPGLRFKVGN